MLILELALLIGGIYALVTARVPSLLVGGGKYQIEGRNARLFGVLLILPIPIVFLSSIILTLLFDDVGSEYVSTLEVMVVFGIAILAVVLMRVVGKPVQHSDNVEATIAKKANGSLIYALLTATGFAAIIFCPLAFIYASQAIKLINEHGVGEQYRGKAKTARVIAGAATLLWIMGAFCFASVLFTP